MISSSLLTCLLCTAACDSSDSSKRAGKPPKHAAVTPERPNHAAPKLDLEGLAPLVAEPEVAWPVEAIALGEGFGWQTGATPGVGDRFHDGLDFSTSAGQCVLAIAPGTIKETSDATLVVVDHGDGIVSRYEKLSDVLVHEGIPVERGACIALASKTLHLEVRVDDVPVDPLLLIGHPLHRPELQIAGRSGAREATDPEPSAQQAGEDGGGVGSGGPMEVQPEAP